MRVIVIYDINTVDNGGAYRLVKIMKTCRKYLTHVQYSVFEGDITEGQLALLRSELLGLVNEEKDFVIIYSLPDGVKLNRDIITNTSDPTDNIL
ncbi:MAG: CRISPR-associated endonuclease Cas2 [Dethiobacteria bacterium]|nr:CRISPR-associated endonuclease Cas2 [Bacillota bacterium]